MQVWFARLEVAMSPLIEFVIFIISEIAFELKGNLGREQNINGNRNQTRAKSIEHRDITNYNLEKLRPTCNFSRHSSFSMFLWSTIADLVA